MTPHKSVRGGGVASYNVKWALSELFHYDMTFVSCHRFPWPTEDIMQLKTRASGVMSLYNRISPHGSE